MCLKLSEWKGARVGQQFRAAKGPQMIPCGCGASVPIRFVFKCFYCMEFFCQSCAREHFGAWNKKTLDLAKAAHLQDVEKDPSVIRLSSFWAGVVVCWWIDTIFVNIHRATWVTFVLLIVNSLSWYFVAKRERIEIKDKPA